MTTRLSEYGQVLAELVEVRTVLSHMSQILETCVKRDVLMDDRLDSLTDRILELEMESNK